MSTQALNSRISLHKTNIKITENRKLNVLKHLYEYSQGKLKIIPIYQTNNYTLLQTKEKTSWINLSLLWIKHELCIHTQMETNIHIYVYIYTHTHTHKLFKKFISKNNYQ